MTTTATAIGTTQVYRVYIKTTPQAIWDAITKPEWTERYGYCGRVDYDLRRDMPYCGYEKFQFNVPVSTDGDCWARYEVRLVEMRESVKIIQQALDGMPEGPVKADAPKIVLPDREKMKTQMEALIHHFKIVTEGFEVPAGEVYQGIEAGHGQTGYYVVSDGTAKPYRVHMRYPSFATLQALETMCKGRMLSDLVAVIGSIDIVLGEIDR